MLLIVINISGCKDMDGAYQITVASDEDSAEVELEDKDVTITIRGRGYGSAEIVNLNDPHKEVLLRFVQFRSLESVQMWSRDTMCRGGLTHSYGIRRLEMDCCVMSIPYNQSSCREGYLSRSTTDINEKDKEYIEVRVPKEITRNKPITVKLEWVEAYMD